jgi:hypothetical protein
MSDKEVYINVKDLRIKIPKNKEKQEDAPKSPMTRFYNFFCNLFTIWFN